MNVLTEQFLLSQAPVDLVPRYNIAPTQDVAVVRPMLDAPGKRELVMMRWGLIPSWARDVSIGARMINARAETVAEKPAFRGAVTHRRCLVLADGYYEWKRVGRAKQPYWIHRIDERPFAMAGLWERWSGAAEVKLDHPLLTCTIITTDATDATSTIHDRMPVILSETVLDDWLTASDVDSAQLDQMLVPCDDSILRADMVSDYVNNARHEGPQCLQR